MGIGINRSYNARKKRPKKADTASLEKYRNKEKREALENSRRKERFRRTCAEKNTSLHRR